MMCRFDGRWKLSSAGSRLQQGSRVLQALDELDDTPLPSSSQTAKPTAKSKKRASDVFDSDDDEEPAPRKPAKPLSAFRGTPSDSDDELPATVAISPRRKPSSAGKPSVPPAKDDAKTKPATRRTTAAQGGKGKPKVKVCGF